MPALFDDLRALREALLDEERAHASLLAGRASAALPSLRNLLHYVPLRRRDVRPLQERLACVGVSSR